MEYRTLGRTGLKVSALGFGGEYLEGKSREQVKSVIDAVIDGGINYIDIFMSEPNVRTDIGLALKGRRESVYIQGHIGSIFEDGQWTRSRDLAKTRFFFEDLLTRLQTDYIDIGMLHCIDSEEEYHQVFDTEILQYALELKKQGKIHYIGISTHTPSIAINAVKTGYVDIVMFSINIAFDFETGKLNELLECKPVPGSKLRMNEERQELYAFCQANNIGLVAMKPLGAGALLDAGRSPFGKELSVLACLQYVIDRPGLTTAVPGFATADEVKEGLRLFTAAPEEKDYSFILERSSELKVSGRCLYCGHCKPCPSHIDIPMVGKLVDLALAGGDSASPTLKGHYDSLSATADDCIECEQCLDRCPFEVNIIEMMARARRIFKH
ncbi:MAG TPA: aldo/keto reductase [Methanocorpusculum sp.]|nr:aldo/keto reductase [Methanocorpusculum sp.]